MTGEDSPSQKNSTIPGSDHLAVTLSLGLGFLIKWWWLNDSVQVLKDIAKRWHRIIHMKKSCSKGENGFDGWKHCNINMNVTFATEHIVSVLWNTFILLSDFLSTNQATKLSSYRYNRCHPISCTKNLSSGDKKDGLSKRILSYFFKFEQTFTIIEPSFTCY
jgi:hypothetical protein